MISELSSGNLLFFGLLEFSPGTVDETLFSVVGARLGDSCTPLSGWASRAGRGCDTSRRARRREEVSTGRAGSVDSPGGRRPGDRSVGQLGIAPGAKSLEPMMLAAKALRFSAVVGPPAAGS
jgi:hypothetical protein